MWNKLQWLMVAALACATLALSGCPKGGGDEAAASDEVAADLFAKNCAICHGKAMEGAPGMSPALTDIKSNWKSPEELAKYLADPQGYAMTDPRLKANHEKYSFRMPQIPTMSDADRLRVAKWLLAQ